MTKKQSEHPSRSKRVLVIILASVVVIAAVVGITIYFNMRDTSADASSDYAISGTVSYNGSQPLGRFYIQVIDSSGGYNGLGTSIASSGKYTIRNVPDGSYTFRAWMDNSNPQTGVPNALSPVGNISVNVNGGDVTGQNIMTIDPAVVPSPDPPASVLVAPGNGSVLMQWSTPVDSEGNTIPPQYYNVYYSTSSEIKQSNSTKIVVQANNHVFVSGLNDGTTYYFVVTSVLGGVETSPSSPVSAIIGASSGSNTISGTISFPLKATGQMYIGVAGQNGSFFQRIERPVSPQSYSISGVPAGSYAAFVTIDMNNNGVIDTGDLNKTNSIPSGGNTLVSIEGDITGMNQTLVGNNVLARVITIHSSSAQSPDTDVHSLEFEVGGNLKLPVSVELGKGPNISAITDMGGNFNYYHLFYAIKGKPNAGDSYVFTINYSDGTSEKVKVSVTAALEGFAQNLTTSGTDRTKPTFSWSAPNPAPSDYTYLIQLGQRTVGQEWIYPQDGNGMPSSQTSVLYNVDGGSSLTALQTGTLYDWIIYVIDSNSNQSVYQTTYTP